MQKVIMSSVQKIKPSKFNLQLNTATSLLIIRNTAFKTITTPYYRHRSLSKMVIISLHGIAIPTGLFYRFLFFLSSFFCFRRLISEITERISTKLGHIFTYDAI